MSDSQATVGLRAAYEDAKNRVEFAHFLDVWQGEYTVRRSLEALIRETQGVLARPELDSDRAHYTRGVLATLLKVSELIDTASLESRLDLIGAELEESIQMDRIAEEHIHG